MKKCSNNSTWASSSHEIFDYESNKLARTDLTAYTNGLLFRNQTEVIFELGELSQSKQNFNEVVLLALIDIVDASDPQKKFRCEPPWLIVKYLESDNKSCKLNLGDKIKLGRQEFKVLEVQGPFKKGPELLPRLYKKQSLIQADAQSIASSSLASSVRVDLVPCRICLGEEINDLTNPIISPCKCSGSMGSIHLNCLRKWIRQKTTINVKPFVTSVQWRTLSCELCKAPYPYAVYFDGTVHELISVPHPRPPYVVLESIGKSSEDASSVHIVSFEQKSRIKVGRSLEAEWRLTDASISRLHAVLVWEQGCLHIEDTSSKFGTLKLAPDPIKMRPNTKLMLQIGKTVCEFRMEESWSLFSCFGPKPKHTKTLSMEEQKEPINIQTCFPNNGKHSLLVVNTRKYQRMVKQEKRRDIEGKLMEEKKHLDERVNFLRTLTVHPCHLIDKGRPCERNLRDTSGNRTTRGAYLPFWETIRIPAGDTADDVVGEEDI